jgi:hypothetical protein
MVRESFCLAILRTLSRAKTCSVRVNVSHTLRDYI